MSFMNTTVASGLDPVGGAAATSGAPTAQVHALLADAAAHFRASLRASPKAVTYLRRRGVSGATAGRFGLGFAASGWHGLSPVLRNYDERTVQASGLEVVNGDDNHCYDRFRDRVMFPIRDRSGVIVGFGGRVLDGTQPKYMNSPESEGFQKRRLLYGLYEARAAIQAEQVALVVEGYMDVVKLSQAGFLPVVGTLGTSCTCAHVAELLSITKRVVFCFDGDDAGRRAASHAVEKILPHANDARSFGFMFLPEGHDPDSFVRDHGTKAFRALLAAALPLASVLQVQVIAGCELQHAEGRARCSALARKFWHALPEGHQRAELLDFCVGVTKLCRDQLLALWTGDH